MNKDELELLVKITQLATVVGSLKANYSVLETALIGIYHIAKEGSNEAICASAKAALDKVGVSVETNKT